MSDIREEVRLALRSPILPDAIERLAAVEGYLEAVWPRIRSSVETAGFIGSAMYMTDMALDAVEQVYDPVFTRDDVLAAGASEMDLAALGEVIDVFHYVQPQVLLLVAAFAEAMGREQVGGYGKPDPRPLGEREEHHLATEVPSAPAETPPLPEVVDALGLAAPPDLYRAVAAWPAYLGVAWQELQHLAAYPDFRRRGRGLYYYARSGARFLAEPLRANPEALREAGLDDATIEAARVALDESLPAIAMMMMHAEAMRLSLGVAAREVVKKE
ncbi:MAG: halocarboxylic acid dehydrogenase DehI family protein [Dehalococcoidia bacterium]